MHYLEQPIKIQFELSTVCNALCLGCVRTDYSFNDSKFTIPSKVYIDISTVFDLLKSKAMESVKVLEFCGTIDEPLVHPQFLELLEGAYKINPEYDIHIHTNGGMRNPEYFTKLANLLTKFYKYDMLFSLDGLEDTNHLYRQNVNWSKCMENAEAFINAGGEPLWQFIIFEWNKHQVEEAETLAKKMGFKHFVSRYDRSIIQAEKLSFNDIQLRKQTAKSLTQYTQTKELYQKVKDKISNPIHCNNMHKGMYFVSYDAKLWPCCFLPNSLLQTDKTTVDEIRKRIFDNYGEKFNSLYDYNADKILQHKFYTSDLVESWSNKLGVGRKDKIFRCVQTCAKGSLPIGDFKWKKLTENK